MMPIDFRDPANRHVYSGRDASKEWRSCIASICDPAGLRAVEIGCGGGIYTRALSEMGATSVNGIDNSEPMLATAREANRDLVGVTFKQGSADNIPLPADSADLILARGLIHHLPTLDDFAAECARILATGGTALIQDRTIEDTRQPAGVDNIRGYFFECFPRLRAYDSTRRWSDESVRSALSGAGLSGITATSIDETRAIHASPAALADQLRARSGRSILHELTDNEIEALIAYILARLPAEGEVVERDQWTIWSATLALQ